jgi:organic hydroperoxide reductase OsmC/OhrA
MEWSDMHMPMHMPDSAASAGEPAVESVPTGTPHLVDANSANDTIELDLIKGFAQEVNWGVAGAPTMVIDEPEPLGENLGPSPGRVLAAALASCLGASLLFCLKKSRIDVQALHTTASVALTRNDKGRLRVGTITVRLEPTVPLDQQPRMARCLEVFEDFCIVTASVRPAVTVDVSVHPIAPVV